MRWTYRASECLVPMLNSLWKIRRNFKMNNEVKAKKHMLCEKAPFLAMILGCLIALIVLSVSSALAGNSFVGQIVSCIAAVVFLIGFNRWFAPEFKGVFKAGISAGEMLIISLPFIFELVFRFLIADSISILHCSACLWLWVRAFLRRPFSEALPFRSR